MDLLFPEEMLTINKLTIHLVSQEEHNRLKESGRKEIIKERTEINEIKTEHIKEQVKTINLVISKN